MKLHDDAIDRLISLGHETLQIPSTIIHSEKYCADYPDEWFIWLGYKNFPSKEGTGFLHLTRVGVEANLDIISAAIEIGKHSSPKRFKEDYTIKDFQLFTQQFYENIRKELDKKIKIESRKLETLLEYRLHPSIIV